MNKRVVLISLGVVALGVGLYFLVPIARLAVVANKAGFFDETKERSYQATRKGNLEAIRTALELSYESDGQYPDAKNWMDTLFTRMKTDDMSEASAKEKFHRPGVPAGGFGYALNIAVAGKIKKEVGDLANTIVIYESKGAEWNANGQPSKDNAGPDAQGLTAAGTVVTVSTLKPAP